MFSEKKFYKNYYWFIPFLAALISRYFYFLNFVNSPYKYYHLIRGLDMNTIFITYPTHNASIYNLFLRIIASLVPQYFFIESVVIVQLILGILSSCFIVYIARQLTNDCRIACISGFIYALYAPVLMYEGVLLKESFNLFFVVFALFMCFYIVANKFSNISLFIFGIIILIPVFVRRVGVGLFVLLFCWFVYSLLLYIYRLKIEYRCQIKIFIKKITILLISVFIMTFTVYKAYNDHLPPVLSVFSNIKYFINVGQQPELLSINHEEKIISNRSIEKSKNEKVGNSLNIGNDEIINDDYLNNFKSYIRNFLLTFRAYEIPNNINYYFIRDLLKPLKYLIGPILLFPLAIAGFILFLFNWKKYNKPELMLIFPIPVVIACVIFLPIARYRVAIVPILVVLAGIYIIKLVDSVLNRQRITVITLIVLFSIFSFAQIISLEKNDIRAADFIAYGQAVRYQNPKSFVILNCFKEAYRIRPDLEYTRKNLIFELLRIGDFVNAEKLLRKEYKAQPGNFETAIDYVASLMGTKQYGKAFSVLSTIKKPVDSERQSDLYFNWGEYYFFTGNYKMALSYYKKMFNLNIPVSDELRKYIYSRVIVMNKKTMK